MAAINVLDKHTAELIAAGEVVERPASVVKELVENSIDAGARNIIVDIERGGVKKIMVQDDGCGIDSEYVQTAFIRHATSKISKKEDLDSIASLGFRGEALASIASVSHLTLITKTEDQDFAVEIKLSGGVETSLEIKPFITGSRFTVQDLFYNTPARMKFLKKDATEAGYIQDILTNLALSRPDISFTFIKDGKEVFATFGDGNLLNTIAVLFTTEFANTLTPVDYRDEKYTIKGYVTLPHSSRQSRNMQYSFINDRFVKNKTVMAAAENRYKGTVMVGKFPGYVLNIYMPFDAVDVNVHPAKTEVRFANDGEMFSTVYRAVKNAISADIPLKQFSFKQNDPLKENINSVKQQAFTYISGENKEENIAHNFVLEKKEADKTVFTHKEEKADVFADNYFNKYITPQFENNSLRLPLNSGEIPYYSKRGVYSLKDNNVTLISEDVSDFENIIENRNSVVFKEETEQESDINISVIGEIFSTYILCKKDDDRLVVIDKHAAHERLLYERLKKNTKRSKQMLLVPVTVKLTAEEQAAVLENNRLLEEQGFEIEEFGTNGVIVRAIPVYITHEDPQALVSEIAYNLANGNKAELSEKIEWIFHSVACRSAIKAGDKAHTERLIQLVKDIFNEKIPLYCPHGRPVIISISKKELEKQFGR